MPDTKVVDTADVTAPAVCDETRDAGPACLTPTNIAAGSELKTGEIQKAATQTVATQTPATQTAATQTAATQTAATQTAATQKSKPSRKVILAYTACAIIWGTTWYGIRISMGPDGYPSYVAAALRFSIASLILLVVWAFRNKEIKPPTRRELTWISTAGLVSGFAYGLLYCAEEHVTGGLAAVISATSPLIAAIIAMSTRTESASKVTLAGSLVSIIGVALVFHDRLQISTAQASAVGLLTMSAILNSTSNVVMKRQAHDTSALASNALFFSTASVMLWAVATCSGKCTIPYPLPVAPTLALLYLTLFGTLLAFAAFFYLLKHVRLSTAMTLSFVCPLVALGVDAILEKQSVLTPESYLGIGVVLAGVVVSVLYKVRKESTSH